MQALKVLVVFMGVLIIAGVIVVVATIVHRSNNAFNETFDKEIVLAEGAKILNVFELSERLAIRVQLSDGTEVVHIFDAFSGDAVGVFRFQSP